MKPLFTPALKLSSMTATAIRFGQLQTSQQLSLYCFRIYTRVLAKAIKCLNYAALVTEVLQMTLFLFKFQYTDKTNAKRLYFVKTPL